MTFDSLESNVYDRAGFPGNAGLWLVVCGLLYSFVAFMYYLIDIAVDILAQYQANNYIYTNK